MPCCAKPHKQLRQPTCVPLGQKPFWATYPDMAHSEAGSAKTKAAMVRSLKFPVNPPDTATAFSALHGEATCRTPWINRD